MGDNSLSNVISINNKPRTEVDCECYYCKQLFEQDMSNSEMIVTSTTPTMAGTDECMNGNTFVNGAQPVLTNANNDANNNNTTPQSSPVTVTSQITINPPIWIPYLERVDNLVNVNYGASQDTCGGDLPLSDMPTLRFFYNLGYEYYRAVSLLQNQNPSTNSSSQDVSTIRYASTVNHPVHSTPVYYPTHQTYTQQLYAMYPPNFPSAGISSGQSPQTQVIPCIAYMQNVQYSGNNVPSQ